MSFKCADRIKEITTTEGTGAIQLAGAVAGFKAFSSYLVNNDTTYYSIEDTLGNWENGFGTYQTGTPDSILRTNIISSSNNNSIVNFGTGDKNIFCTNPADGTALIQDDGVSNRLIETDADITTTGTTTSDSVLVSNDFIYEAPGGAVTFQVRSLGDFEVFQTFNSSVNNWAIGIEKSFSPLYVPTIGDSFAINPGAGFASEAFVNLEPGVFPNPGTAHFWENNIHLGTELVLFDSQQTLLDGVTSGEIIFKTNDTSNPNSIASRVFTRASGTTGNVDMVFESGTIGALSDTLVLDTNNNATFAGDITTSGDISTTSTGDIRSNDRVFAGNGALTDDDQFYMGTASSVNPAIFWATSGGSNDYTDFVRTSNTYRWIIDNAQEMTLDASLLNLQDNNITTTGEVSGAHINLKATDVVSLPAAASNTGDMYRVTDANAPSMGATVSGGGSANAMVWSNGTNWKVFGI